MLTWGPPFGLSPDVDDGAAYMTTGEQFGGVVRKLVQPDRVSNRFQGIQFPISGQQAPHFATPRHGTPR